MTNSVYCTGNSGNYADRNNASSSSLLENFMWKHLVWRNKLLKAEISFLSLFRRFNVWYIELAGFLYENRHKIIVYFNMLQSWVKFWTMYILDRKVNSSNLNLNHRITGMFYSLPRIPIGYFCYGNLFGCFGCGSGCK